MCMMFTNQELIFLERGPLWLFQGSHRKQLANPNEDMSGLSNMFDFRWPFMYNVIYADIVDSFLIGSYWMNNALKRGRTAGKSCAF